MGVPEKRVTLACPGADRQPIELHVGERELIGRAAGITGGNLAVDDDVQVQRQSLNRSLHFHREMIDGDLRLTVRIKLVSDGAGFTQHLSRHGQRRHILGQIFDLPLADETGRATDGRGRIRRGGCIRWSGCARRVCAW